ncbi:hypothetical protein ULMS_24390 [Patiriisocius marinistellae]|uniref:DUF3857 domain-containing protein n=1 Tax=Patiriisocius marinistellae TaxID=2494560 RepID=A0A5J4G3I5_9FLAO|nr:DUF3857 domain-containing protein [Patiriisocius marinistellae]GEQ86931.1 hypothetical protein ULMS_24390 [Patiriisocius marinistellae]
MRITYFFLLSFINFFSNAQDYSVNNIDATLIKNANAVVRNETTTITINDFDSLEEEFSSTITVLNRGGWDAIDPVVYYSGDDKVKKISAILYDRDGDVIEKYKEKDFLDVTASGSNLYSDNRKKILEFIPSSYPFTLTFEYELKSRTTGFLKQWLPLRKTTVAVESSNYKIVNERQIPIIKKAYNLDNFDVTAKSLNGNLDYTIKNVLAFESEFASPHYSMYLPIMRVALKKFQLEGEIAEVSTWKDFGIWQNENLLKDRDKLSDATKSKINELVKDLDTKKEKVKAIYEYMQNKTRYISIQVGIGGWQPSAAQEVDELGYGDCKGLTNYTKALLDTQNIPSYYTIVDSGSDGRDIEEDFVAMQGNHVILTVPLEEENLFLECTSQDLPFNFIGTHTDDRKVVMLTPDGGVVGKTHSYTKEDNTRNFEATVVLDENLIITGTLKEVSRGIEYDNSYYLKDGDSDELDAYYKKKWSHLNGLQLSNIKFDNDKVNVVFTQELSFLAKNYTSKAGDRLLLNPNVFNRFAYIPDVNGERKQSVYVRRGKTFNDTTTIILPKGYKVESMFDTLEVSNKFGSYKATLVKKNETTLIYSRNVVLYAVDEPKESFNELDTLIRKLVKNDNSKIVLIKK